MLVLVDIEVCGWVLIKENLKDMKISIKELLKKDVVGLWNGD